VVVHAATGFFDNMAVPAFIVTSTGQVISTAGLSISPPERGIITFWSAGVLVGQESFNSLEDAQAQYTYYVSILTEALAAPTVTIPSTGTPFTFSYAATLADPPAPFYLTGTNFAPGGYVKFDTTTLPTLISSDTNCVATYTYGTLGVGTYDVTYVGPDAQTAVVTGGLEITA
jgi:hypothetical protein